MAASGLKIHYPISATTLDNGLRVQVCPDKYAAGVAINLWFRVGSGDESVGKTGFAHLFEHLMFQGSKNVMAGEHLGLIQSIGGQCNATTSFDRTNYFETVPKRGLELALWLEAERLASLDVSQTNLDTQREVVKGERRQRYDNVPYGDFLELILQLNFPPNHCYAHSTIGSMTDLENASLTDVKDFFNCWYRPDGAVISLVGDISENQGFELVNKYFGDIPTGSNPVPKQLRPNQLPAHNQVPVLRVTRQVQRSTITCSWRTPPVTHPDFDAIQLALAVLAGSESSRLYRQLVRDSGEAETITALDSGLVRGTSVAMIHSRVSPESTTETIRDHILMAVNKLCEDGPSEAELSRVKAGFEHDWLSQLALIDSRANQMSGAYTLFDDVDYVNNQFDTVIAITAEQVAQAAIKWLSPIAHGELHYLGEQ